MTYYWVDFYSVVYDWDSVRTNNELCNDYGSTYLEGIANEIDYYYYEETNVDCESEYPDDVTCCKNFYQDFATESTCPDWQNTPFT